MNIKNILILPLALIFGLVGCTTQPRNPMSLSADQMNRWSTAAESYRACNKTWWSQLLTDAPQLNQLVSSRSDPQYLQKLISKEPVTDVLKSSLIKYRPQLVSCRQALFKALGEDNLTIKIIYQKNFDAMDDIVVKVLDGQLKTMGDINRAYVAANNADLERKSQLRAMNPQN